MILRLKLFTGNYTYTLNTGAANVPSFSNSVISTNVSAPPANASTTNVATNTTNTQTPNKRLTKAQLQEQVNGLSQTNTQLQGQIKDVTRSRYEAGAYRGRQAGLIEGQRIGIEKGKEIGMKQTGVFQGLQNTWNKAGTMKKIGMGGAALAGTYFLGKGLLGGNNNNDQ